MKLAVLILADSESHADLGRLVNALELANEAQEEGDDVEVIFDGAGTTWIPELEDPDHPSHALYTRLQDDIEVCEYCAGAFDAEADIESADVPLVSEYDGHPSVRSLVAEGYEVVSF